MCLLKAFTELPLSFESLGGTFTWADGRVYQGQWRTGPFGGTERTSQGDIHEGGSSCWVLGLAEGLVWDRSELLVPVRALGLWRV